MAEEEQGGEQKSSAPAPSGSGILFKIQFIIFWVLIFVLLTSGVGLASFIGNWLDNPINWGSGGSGGGGSLSTSCKDIPDDLIPIFNAAGGNGVSPALLAAISKIESNHNPNVGTNSVGARGLMQFMPATWVGWSYTVKDQNGDPISPWDENGNGPWITKMEEMDKNDDGKSDYGGYATDVKGDGEANPDDPEDSIHSAAKYIGNNLKANGGDIDDALGQYNGGGNWRNKPESIQYVEDVKKWYEEYKTCLSGGVLTGETSEYGFMWPVTGPISDVFGSPRPHGSHNGIDIAVGKGTVVRAAKGGTVIAAGTIDEYCGWGVQIDHGDGFHTVYCHFSNVGVSSGTNVEIGQSIGLSGGIQGEEGSGSSSGAHLHFGMIKDGSFVDPLLYLPKK